MAIPDLSVESRLGPYRLLRILGEGGMGTVYLGHDDALDRRVAIKVLRAEQDEKVSATLARRFLREAQSAARINHPHVVTIYTAERHRAGDAASGGRGGQPYIVMEYVEGGSLAQHIRQTGPMPWRDATRTIRDALLGLAAAHARGVIHRDIKPANLMRAHAGGESIKLVDFGLARVVMPDVTARDPDLTFPGAFVGSPSYSAPEQISGIARIDGRADLYSVAATWYALLTAQPPFIEDDPAHVMERHLRDPFPDVRILSPAVPEEVQRAIAKASRKKITARFASAAAMLDTVERLLRLPALSSQASPPPPASPPLRRAEETVCELETRLALARQKADSTTQLATLRTLYGLYAQLDRRTDALQAFREALAVHVKLEAPHHLGNN